MKKIFALILCIVLLASCLTPLARASDCVPGDVNGDTDIDGRDLIRLKQYLSGNEVVIVEEAADVNGDTKIDGRDAIRLAQYLAGQGRSDDPDPEYPPFDADVAIAQAKEQALAKGYKWMDHTNAGYGTVYIKRTKTMDYIVKKLVVVMDGYHEEGKNTFNIQYLGIVTRYDYEEYFFKVYYATT